MECDLVVGARSSKIVLFIRSYEWGLGISNCQFTTQILGGKARPTTVMRGKKSRSQHTTIVRMEKRE